MTHYRTTASDRAAIKLRKRAHAAMDEWREQREAQGKVTDIPEPIECDSSYLSRRLRGIMGGHGIRVRGGDETLMKAAARIFHITGFGNDIGGCLAKLQEIPRKQRRKLALQAKRDQKVWERQSMMDRIEIRAAAEAQRLRKLMGEA